MRRRECLWVRFASERLPPLTIRVHVMFDQGAHANRGLNETERLKFRRHQEAAQREFAASGIRFEVDTLEGVYLRTQGYSEMPDQFLALGKINLFVTDTLRYDVDRDRTGGASIGPFPSPRIRPSLYPGYR